MVARLTISRHAFCKILINKQLNIMTDIYNTSVKKFSAHNPIIWGIGSILFGVLLIAWQGELLNKLVLVLGVISLVIGVVQFFNFLRMTKGMANRWSMFPLGTVVALIFGLMLVISPSTWVNVLMVLIGVVVLLLALVSISNLVSVRKVAPVKWWYFLYPVLQMLAGVAIIVNPSFLADFLMIFAGLWIIMYGITEFVGYFMFKR